MRVVIVGAGIVGLCTARALLARGAADDTQVTVVEKGPIPCPTAASADHHRLIRLSYPDHPGYARRIAEAFAAWDRLFAELPRPTGHYYADRGILTLSQRAGDYGDRTRAMFEAEGIAHQAFDSAAALTDSFPVLEARNVASGTLSRGGALMANRIITDLADTLRARGATLIEHAPAIAIDPGQGRVSLIDGRVIDGDLVVVTAGAGMHALLPAMAQDLSYMRTLIVYARPPDDLAEAWEGAPCWTDLGGDDDLWGMPPIGGLPAKLGCGAMGRTDPDDGDRIATLAEAETLMGKYRGGFRGLDRFSLAFAQANYWMLAPGARFMLRREGRVIAASACSGHGFKFGALSGEDIAEAVLAPERFDDVAARMAARDGAEAPAGREARA
ncbi:MAG: FAD-dependent oxidoreductase [Pseudomonadota bacterium]